MKGILYLYVHSLLEAKCGPSRRLTRKEAIQIILYRVRCKNLDGSAFIRSAIIDDMVDLGLLAKDGIEFVKVLPCVRSKELEAILNR